MTPIPIRNHQLCRLALLPTQFQVNSGRTLYEVQQILGHSNSKVTERYAHLSTETLQDAANTASDYLTRALEEKS